MLSDDLTIESLTDGARVALTLAGEIDFGNVARLRSALLDAAQAGVDIDVDMEAVSFIDSTALGLLVQTQKRVAEGGRRLVLTGLNPRVRRVFELTGLTDLFELGDASD